MISMISSLLVLLALGSFVLAAEVSPAHRERGKVILKEILAQAWATSWQEATLENVRLVAQKKDLAQPTGLPPVWHAGLKGPDGRTGYLMWDCKEDGRLVEFALDDALPVREAITGIPPLQQFPVIGPDGKAMASGCVPTSAASLLSYWIDRRHQDGPPTRELTLTLRKQLRMIPFPDTDGFTPDGMTLAGALPLSMAKVLEGEMARRKWPLAVRHLPFSMKHFREEIAAGRPTLLSCTVRVPHLPHLSWGHAVVGIAANRIDEVDLVGIHDNFYPTRNPGTIRWISSDAFRSLTVVVPKEN